MELSKEGFIYIWYDQKRKMFYIGCHWGHENDGYICSSKRMRSAYDRRPSSFKRRIIQRNIPRENLLKEEFKWLSLIQDHELGKRYYNLSKKHFGHWANDSDSNTSMSRKLSIALIEKYKDPTYRQTMREKVWNKTKGRKQTPEEKKKRAEKLRGQRRSDKTREKMRQAQLTPEAVERNRNKMLGEKNFFYGKRLTGEQNGFYGKKHSDKTKHKLSEANKGMTFPNRPSNAKGTVWWTNGIINKRCVNCPGDNWSKGRKK